MTINIAIAVAEGLVLAADSMTQIQMSLPGGQQGVAITYPAAEKLTEISELPMAAMVHGIGAIANRSILSLIREFEFDHFVKNPPNPPDHSVEAVTRALSAFIQQRYAQASWPAPPVLGIVVGGYSPGAFFPEVYDVRYPGPVITKKHPQNPALAPGTGSMTWWGVTAALDRLVLGFDLNELQTIHVDAAAGKLDAIAQTAGLPKPQAAHCDPRTVLDPLRPYAQMRFMLDGMPLQDAAEFADYLGGVAIGFSRFSQGAPAVGGELDVLAIQPEGLSWYRRKAFPAKMAAAREVNRLGRP